MEKKRILIVDDHELFRSGIAKLLEAEEDFQVIAQASNGETGIEIAREQQPDLILMDLQMPKCDGLKATKTILGELPETKIVLLTAFDDDKYIFETIAAGAVGFLLKDTSPNDFIRFLRGVFKGEAAISKKLSEKIVNLLVFGKADPHRFALNNLSEREDQVLQLVAKGYSNKDIGRQLVISQSTVKNHLHNIMHKLRINNRVELAGYTLTNKPTQLKI